MSDSEENKTNSANKMWFTIANKAAIVAVIFAIILSILMIANYIQTKSIDPLNSKAISQLMLQLQENPNDEALKEQIRALDLLARKAYFTHQWQIRTGSFLLFAFVLIVLIALKYTSSLKSQLPDFSADTAKDNTWLDVILARKYIIYGGLGLFGLAFLLGILSENELSKIGTTYSDATLSSGDWPSIEKIKENWPNFRGPEGIGVAYNTDVPSEWDGATGVNIRWKIPIPLSGFNSPIIWEDRIFLTGAEGSTETIYCIHAETGEILWQQDVTDVPGAPEEPPAVSFDTGLAASTMATDGKRIYAIFASGDLVCYDFEGRRIWAKNLGVPDNHYGHSSSLITFQNLLLVQYDQNTGGRLLAFQTRTGDLIYDVVRDGVTVSWASPILVNTGERYEIILNANPFVISYDPLTGQELWRVECIYGEIGTSLAYADGVVYSVNEYARLAAISLSETPALLWEFDEDLSEISSPLATKDFVFVATSYGTVSCIDTKTGERYWYHDFDDGFYSSPILVDNNIYIMDMKGVMYIIKVDNEFQLVNQCELGETAVTTPVFMHDRIYIRGDENLYCIGNE